MAGELFESLGRIAGSLGLGWRCPHCDEWSNAYTGNIIDGTARCPNCGLNPSPFCPGDVTGMDTLHCSVNHKARSVDSG